MWIEEVKTKDGNIKYNYFERYNDPLTGKTRKVSTLMNSKSNQAKKQALKVLTDKIDKKLNVVRQENKLFKEVFDEWFSIYKQTVKSTSYIKIQYAMNHISKHIQDDYIIHSIGTNIVQDLINHLYYKENYSYNYVSNIKTALNMIFEYAVERNYITNNPVLKVKIKKKKMTLEEIEKVENKFLEKNEITLLLEELRKNKKSKRIADLCEFITLTGLRIGELLALKTSNYNGKYVDVKGTLNYTTEKYTDIIIESAKTKTSNRKVDLPKRAQVILDNIIEENHFMNLSEKYEDNDLIFTTVSGSPIAIGSINTSIQGVAKKININKHLTTHIFRHTHISLLAELGTPIKAIMSRVGHSDYETTLKIYTHVTEKMKDDLIEKLNTIEL